MFNFNSEGAGVYANPTIDFAFKRIFGTEKFKAATIGLLNAFITDHTIVDVTFLQSEIPKETKDGRTSIIDILCQSDDGTRFVVEMQRHKQEYFMERMVYYSSKVIVGQEKMSDWEYNLSPTYVIAFMCFDMDDMKDTGTYIEHYESRELTSGKRLAGSPIYYLISLSVFNKKLEELCGDSENWLYLLRNSMMLTDKPKEFAEGSGFEAYFEASRRAQFTRDEATLYEEQMTSERDIKNAIKYAAKQGMAEGLAAGEEKGRAEGLAEGEAKGRSEGIIETARNFKLAGVDVAIIMQCTGLTEQQIAEL